MPENKTLLTYDQAAKLLNVHPVTLRRLVSAGKIPHHKIGSKAVRFNPDELMQETKVEASA